MKQICLLLAISLPMLLSVITGAQSSNPAFDKEFAAGKADFASHKNEDAAKHFKKANKLQGENCSECYVWLTRVELAKGDLKNALKQADKGLATARSDQEHANAQLFRGVILTRMSATSKDKANDAEAAFRAAAAANPKCAECRFDLGFMLMKQRKDDEGVAIMEAVLPEYRGSAKEREIRRFIADPGRARKDFAPEFSARLASGEELNLDVLQGKVVLLDFWGSWCGPCRESVPALKQLFTKLDSSKAMLISIDEGDSQEKWAQFVQKNQMTWPQIFDEGSELAEAYSVHSFPHYFLISKNGIILEKMDGWEMGREEALRKAIEKTAKE